MYAPGLVMNSEANSAAYYQIESPPCYTIATGLPSYDEALHNNAQHFGFGMKFMYPQIAAIHPGMLASSSSACQQKQNPYTHNSIKIGSHSKKDAACMQGLLSSSSASSAKTEIIVASTDATLTMTSSAFNDKAEEACLNAVIVA